VHNEHSSHVPLVVDHSRRFEDAARSPRLRRHDRVSLSRGLEEQEAGGVDGEEPGVEGESEDGKRRRVLELDTRVQQCIGGVDATVQGSNVARLVAGVDDLDGVRGVEVQRTCSGRGWRHWDAR